jgi:hypothetical protein
MKTGWPFLPGVALCLSLYAAALAPSAAPPIPDDIAPASPDDIRAELKKLLLADSMRIARSEQAKAPATHDQGGPGAVVMSPYVVKEPRYPRVNERVFEPPLMRFLRDGTLYENAGRKLTTRLRLRLYSTDEPPADPDEILPPTMFGNVRPVNGAQLGLSWSW